MVVKNYVSNPLSLNNLKLENTGKVTYLLYGLCTRSFFADTLKWFVWIPLQLKLMAIP